MLRRLPPLQPNNQPVKKARRISLARLSFIAFFCFFVCLFAFLLIRYAVSFRRIPVVFAAQPPAETVAAVEDTAGRLDINRATLEELDALPGIGPVLAQAILDYRAQFGAFFYAEEITDVPGIGEKRFEALAPLITCIPLSP